MISLSSTEYRFEKLSLIHYPLLEKLFFRVYKVRLSPDDLEKRFNTSLLGKNVIGFIAIHIISEEPAAYYGVFPMNVLIEDKAISIGQSGDLMTDPLHRNKNLFIQLAELAHKVCYEEGMKIIISQPNENSLHGFVNKLGFKKMDEIIRWDLRLKLITIPLSKLVHRYKTIQKLYLPYAKHILKKYIISAPLQFNNPLKIPIGKVIRDRAYTGYKNSDDRFFIKIDTIIIWIRLTDVFWIGDFSDYEIINTALIKKIKKLAFLLGYNTISFNMNSSVPLPKSLFEFKKYSSQSSCLLYLDAAYKDVNLILAAADSDTW